MTAIPLITHFSESVLALGEKKKALEQGQEGRFSLFTQMFHK